MKRKRGEKQRKSEKGTSLLQHRYSMKYGVQKVRSERDQENWRERKKNREWTAQGRGIADKKTFHDALPLWD